MEPRTVSLTSLSAGGFLQHQSTYTSFYGRAGYFQYNSFQQSLTELGSEANTEEIAAMREGEEAKKARKGLLESGTVLGPEVTRYNEFKTAYKTEADAG